MGMAMLLTLKLLGVYCEPMISRLHRHHRTFTALSSPPAIAHPSVLPTATDCRSG